MTTMTRRRFVANAALAVAASGVRAQANGSAAVTLNISADATGPHMPEDFVGLSYEVQQLTDPAFFSPANAGLIEQFKKLATHGVLRLGGNTSEFGYWKPTPDSPEPEHPHTREVEGEPKAQYYAVTPDAVRSLAAFLRATGWTCLYGIGMGTNTPERAAAEAEFVAKTLGANLQYFQIGNEADLFSNHLRDPKTWGVKPYLDEWLALARAVAAKVPDAKFGMPDVAMSVGWLPEIAGQWPSIQNPPHVTRLTHHYYFGGPATNPEVNIPNLMKPATMARVQKDADTAMGAAKKMGAGVRMTEGNTCYRGGKPGVSDVFASALWAADYALLLAASGYSGVNLHGGTGKSVANSVGGFLPGDVLLKEQGKTAEEIATHPHPFYTPIGTFGDKYALQPVAYGLKFAGSFAGATFVGAELTTNLQAAGVNATAYAAKLSNGAVSVIILNKDLDKDVAVTLKLAGKSGSKVEIEKLEAPGIDSRETHVTRGSNGGVSSGAGYVVQVPKASGVRVTFG
ncbi:MAG TPA: hypothetical protein VGL22_01000 [Terracidiphilus sp.]